MVLLHHIVEILALAQTNSARQRAGGFQGCHGGRKCTVLIHVDDPWDRIARRAQSFTKKALSGCRVSSNWSWTRESDKLGQCLNSQEGTLSEEFFESGPKSDIGKMREEWREHLGANPEDFRSFIETLHLQLGEGSFRQLQQMVSDRMEHVGLQHDQNALAVAVDVIRNWIRTKQADITADLLEQVLKERSLYLPAEGERCVTVYLNTITEGAFDLTPDFVLDWRRHFEGRPDLKGHQLKDPKNWNKKLLPELRSVLADVRKTTNCRFVRARGLARLSAWCAFGLFDEVREAIERPPNPIEKVMKKIAPLERVWSTLHDLPKTPNDNWLRIYKFIYRYKLNAG